MIQNASNLKSLRCIIDTCDDPPGLMSHMVPRETRFSRPAAEEQKKGRSAQDHAVMADWDRAGGEIGEETGSRLPQSFLDYQASSGADRAGAKDSAKAAFKPDSKDQETPLETNK